MKLFLLTAPLRNRYKAQSIDHSVEVPDKEAVYLLNCGIARADREAGSREAAVVVAEENAAAGAEGGEQAGGGDDEGEGGGDEGSQGEGDQLPPWTLKTPPAEYLEKYPDGKWVELARKHVEAAGQ